MDGPKWKSGTGFSCPSGIKRDSRGLKVKGREEGQIRSAGKKLEREGGRRN